MPSRRTFRRPSVGQVAAGNAFLKPVPIGAKVEHVLRAPQSRRHRCHWPGCLRQVPPAMWGCKPHWYALPLDLRDRVWRTYRPGQEDDGAPSRDYIEIAREVQAWIREHDPAPCLL